MLFTDLFSIHFQIGYVFIIKHRSLNIEDRICIQSYYNYWFQLQISWVLLKSIKTILSFRDDPWRSTHNTRNNNKIILCDVSNIQY